MNITDYLVDYLKTGKAVEIPQVGVLAAQEEEAHFDKATSTFYPTRTTIRISSDRKDSSDFIQHLADKECVSKPTAEKIWKNYVDALTAKIASEGRCQLSDVGALVCTDGHYTFETSDNVSLNGTAKRMQPVTGIRSFSATESGDPFAAFDQPLKEGPVTSDSLLTGTPKATEKHAEPATAVVDEPVVADEPETFTEPEPVVEEEPVVESEPVVEKEPVVEEEPVTVTEPEPVVEEKQIVEDKPVVEENSPAFTEKIAEKQEPAAKEEPVIEDEPAVAVEPSTENESEPKPTQPKAFDDSETINTLHQLDAIDESDGSEEKAIIEKRNNKGKEKKKGGFWKALLWILTILLVLLACAAVIDRYIFNSSGRDWVLQQFNFNTAPKASTNDLADFQASAPADYDKATALDNLTEYTYSLEGLQFADDEIESQRDAIVGNLQSYLDKFLKTIKQGDNQEIFLAQVNSYTLNRLKDLLTDNEFHFQSLLTYKDYVREDMMPMLKEKVMHRKANTVQGELMNYETLERILSEVVPADELTPDPAAIAEQEAAEQKAAAAAAQKKANKPAPVKSHIATASKQGYDLIAGTSVFKNNADRLCSQLKAKGCDAYIINRNGMYYVSMGSAASRTEIEAKYIHVKEWYKGDVTIKKW
ncbi:MAG: hypothetical protein IJK07_02810 [Bacteroidales bacterium]|nr:hypothetical protein [Bacteroidales bacterium]